MGHWDITIGLQLLYEICNNCYNSTPIVDERTIWPESLSISGLRDGSSKSADQAYGGAETWRTEGCTLCLEIVSKYY